MMSMYWSALEKWGLLCRLYPSFHHPSIHSYAFVRMCITHPSPTQVSSLPLSLLLSVFQSHYPTNCLAHLPLSISFQIHMPSLVHPSSLPPFVFPFSLPLFFLNSDFDPLSAWHLFIHWSNSAHYLLFHLCAQHSFWAEIYFEPSMCSTVLSTWKTDVYNILFSRSVELCWRSG